MKKIILFAVLSAFLCCAKAETPDSTKSSAGINKKRLATAIVTESVVYGAGMYYLTNIWYEDRAPVPFHFYNDNSGYLQIDKCGHATTAYVESWITYKWFQSTGLPKSTSLIIGSAVGFAMQAPIEIADGFNEGWGFSWGDMVANTAGIALMAGQELLFDEQIVKVKFSFWRSPYADQAHGYLGRNFLESMSKDYNGHTYWLSGNLSSMLPKSNLPPWLNIAVGYSANGMIGEFENKLVYNNKPIPHFDRTRQFLVSLDIDWTKIPTNSGFLKVLFEGLNILKIPFPAIEINSQGKFNAYWLYF
jgi:hypothetical protein